MKTKFIIIIITATLLLSSCSSLLSKNSGKRTVSSSLVDFLYPSRDAKAKAKENHQATQMPVLELPINVGLAFVPTRHNRGIHAQEQIKLLQKVKASFSNYKFINRIEIIPSNYLQAGKGFSSLDQVSRLYNVDVMALVSYDQVTQSKENNASLLYWSIVGMYLIPGNKNSVQTFVDTAIFDLKSRKMLFRAPGISKGSRVSTAIGVDETIRKTSQKGYEDAVTDMIKNLDSGLGEFKERVKEGKVAKVVHRKNYSGGGGSFGIVIPFLLLFMMIKAYYTRQVRKTYRHTLIKFHSSP